jgi:hypothetical protein
MVVLNQQPAPRRARRDDRIALPTHAVIGAIPVPGAGNGDRPRRRRAGRQTPAHAPQTRRSPATRQPPDNPRVALTRHLRGTRLRRRARPDWIRQAGGACERWASCCGWSARG